jgi:S1-C subfamily serine protease
LALGAPAALGDLAAQLDSLLARVQEAVVTVESYRPGLVGDASGATVGGYRLIISSGVLLPDGQRVVTTAAGVEPCDSIVVRVRDSLRIAARLRGRDPGTRVALLELRERIPVRENLLDPVAPESLPAGGSRWVAALGFASGFSEPVLTVGRLAGYSYARQGKATRVLLRTTAPIFAGSSGGALVDLEGRWVGLLAGSCVAEGEAARAVWSLAQTRPQAALALPVGEVLAAVQRILGQSTEDEAFLGVRIALRQGEGIRGVQVMDVLEHCPAHGAGLLPGDFIQAIDGQPVDSPQALKDVLSARRPGDVVQLRVLRGGEEHVLQVTLGSRQLFESRLRALEASRQEEKRLREEISRLQTRLQMLRRSARPPRRTTPGPALADSSR